MATGHKAKIFNPAAIVSSTLKGKVNVYTGWFAGHGIDNFYDYYYGEKK